MPPSNPKRAFDTVAVVSGTVGDAKLGGKLIRDLNQATALKDWARLTVAGIAKSGSSQADEARNIQTAIRQMNAAHTDMMNSLNRLNDHLRRENIVKLVVYHSVDAT